MPAFVERLLGFLPPHRVVTDELRRVAYGTDASFYRLVPEVVVVIDTEDEMRALMAACRAGGRALTLRAAGTSLSGQAVTRGVLAMLGDGWREAQVLDAGRRIRLGPAVVGAEANRLLAPYGRKIGPDPASINACKIGGIAANNASGMCCGTAQNSYQTLAGLRLMLADGALVDTEDAASVAAFRRSHADLLAALGAMADGVKADAALSARIRHKFRIKNTTGYSLNALIDFEDPLDILAHLMIGSEGTLGFMSRISYCTVVEQAHKATAFLLFADIAAACRAVTALKGTPVAAAELLDRASLRAVEEMPGVPASLRGLGPDAAGLLVETRAQTAGALAAQIAAAQAVLAGMSTLEPVAFSLDPTECARLWDIRKGVFPAVGGRRRPGTTVLIEDVAFPLERLAEATVELAELMRQHGYPDGVIYGHALDGNLHFIFTQDFGDPAEVARYEGFMRAVCDLVVCRFDGSLKAEHGTGRNMAPFVEFEWGREATELMWRIKQLLDPQGLLNPDVVLTRRPRLHLENLKPMPTAHARVDACIECGFCEPQCPSAGLTFTPRQRIVATRERSNPASTINPEQATVSYRMQALDSCAGCGLCATVCPVGIDTGGMVRSQRAANVGPLTRLISGLAAHHFDPATRMARTALTLGRATGAVVGEPRLRQWTGGAWKPGLRAAARGACASPGSAGNTDARVVYFPTCAGRIFGSEQERTPLSDVVVRLLERAGFAVVMPQHVERLCCGQSFESRGLPALANAKAQELELALHQASEGGRLSVVADASACSKRMKHQFAGRLQVLDFAEFAHDQMLPRLDIIRRQPEVALHHTCSSRHMGTDGKAAALVGACAERVHVPVQVTCCGFGGDRGFAVPALNAHALRSIKPGGPSALPSACAQGYSTNLTCEIGLSEHSGVAYRSVAYLLDECTRPSEPAPRVQRP